MKTPPKTQPLTSLRIMPPPPPPVVALPPRVIVQRVFFAPRAPARTVVHHHHHGGGSRRTAGGALKAGWIITGVWAALNAALLFLFLNHPDRNSGEQHQMTWGAVAVGIGFAYWIMLYAGAFLQLICVILAIARGGTVGALLLLFGAAFIDIAAPFLCIGIVNAAHLR